MTPTEIRELAARRAIEVALIRAHPNLTDGALQYLVQAAEKTLEWQAAVAGTEDFDVTGCVRACEQSDVGQLIFSRDDDDDGVVDHAAATQDMTPHQKLQYAREHGLK